MDWQLAEVRYEQIELPARLELPSEFQVSDDRLEVGDRSWPLPFAPTRGRASDRDRDGCPDLELADGDDHAIVAWGRCPLPDRLEVKAGTVLDVHVGDSLLTQLTVPGPVSWAWSSRGGPPGLWVHRDGTIDFDFGPDDVGRYEVRIKRRDPALPVAGRREVPIELRVHPTDARDLDLDKLETQRPPRKFLGSLELACELGLGATTGLSYTPGSTWLHVGYQPLNGAVSPAAAGACSLGNGLRAVVGVEVFPWLDLSPRRAYGTGQVGIDGQVGPFRVGGFAEVAANEGREDLLIWPTAGFGARWWWEAVRHSGPDVRVAWIPRTGARATAGWTWSLAGK